MLVRPDVATKLEQLAPGPDIIKPPTPTKATTMAIRRVRQRIFTLPASDSIRLMPQPTQTQNINAQQTIGPFDRARKGIIRHVNCPRKPHHRGRSSFLNRAAVEQVDPWNPCRQWESRRVSFLDLPYPACLSSISLMLSRLTG